MSPTMCCDFAANGPKEPQRFGAVIGIKPEMIAEYTRLHSGDNCTVRDLLRKANLTVELHTQRKRL